MTDHLTTALRLSFVASGQDLEAFLQDTFKGFLGDGFTIRFPDLRVDREALIRSWGLPEDPMEAAQEAIETIARELPVLTPGESEIQ